MTKILLVEDDKSLSEIYSVRLRAEGYEGVQVDFIDENKEPAKTQPFAGMYYYLPATANKPWRLPSKKYPT